MSIVIDVDDGIAAMTPPGRGVAPRIEAQAAYADIYARHRELHPALKPFRPAA